MNLQNPDTNTLNPSHVIAPLMVVIGNLIPLYGVLVWQWSLFDIFYLYWAENVIIGGFTVIRMLLAGAAWGWAILLGSLFYIGFFAAHYGMFTFAHGMIMFEIFYDGAQEISEEFIFAYALTKGDVFLYALSGLMIAVLMQTLKAIREDRKEARTPHGIMFRPYGRILVLHTTIILGGLLAESLGAPIWALVFLIVLKILYDLAVLRGFKDKDDDNNKEENDGKDVVAE